MVKARLGEQLRALGRSRLLFIRRPERRHEAGLACYHARSSERDPRLFAFELDAYEDLLDVDFTALADLPETRGPLLLACTHGKRDRCCARYGQPLYDELRRQPEGATAWQSSHVGGDRFAGNLVVLPEGLYFGRVGRAEVRPVLDDHTAGRIRLAHFRGRSCYPLPVQAAEHRLRTDTGLDAIDALVLEHAGPAEGGAGWCVRFSEDATGAVHELDVEARAGEPTFLTCDAASPQRPRRYVTTAHRVLPA